MGAKIQPLPPPRLGCQWASCVLKDAPWPSLRGLPCHHCKGRRVQERSPHPGMCLPRNRGKEPLEWAPSTHLPQLEGEAAYSEAGTNRNEFLDCSILLPGP